MKNIILASGSPRRKELLSQISIEFQIKTSDVDEVITKNEPGDIVEELSRIKAMAVSESIETTDTVIIGADTIVFYDGRVLGKPESREHAHNMIKMLSGNVHQVYTGVTFVIDGDVHSFHECTDVCVCSMDEDEINAYVATGECDDKAGAYGIQGAFAAYISGINGDYNNVVGLPLSRVYHELKEAGVL